MANAQIIFKPAQSAGTLAGQESQQPDRGVHTKDRFSRLLATGPLSLPVVLIALLSAMGLGALHALSPGHGKTIVAAYLVGSKGAPKHALFLGVAVTLTHTFGVFLLGMVTLFASRYILPEQLYPWLGTTSGLIVVGIGVTLFMKRLRFSRMGRNSINHRHEHGHGFHAHTHEPQPNHDKHVHHSHSHRSISHHHHGDDHTHHGHSHLPPGMDGSPVTWRSLLALGISGGILPCPSALVVLLGAISLNHIGFGLILIVAFSIGLAGVLTIIGLLFVTGRDLLGRFTATSRVVRFLPTASAFIIIILGTGITLNGLKEFFI